MASLEERVAFLEGRVVEQSRATDGIREALVSLERRVDARFALIEQRFGELERRMDARFGEVESSIRHLEERMDARFFSMDQRFESIDSRFIWLVGIQVTTLAAVIGAIVTR